MNAESLGFSKTNFASAGENVSWVLTRLVVRMDRYPKWEDEVSAAPGKRSSLDFKGVCVQVPALLPAQGRSARVATARPRRERPQDARLRHRRVGCRRR